ncbi:2-phospho-L-lactate guanylyltransferase [Halanaeroarchaeum sulfurireducens]|uniref:2-phospho-L-lactate guanylyltransferase n=1 Tax=Halanaeroarchaeum sulfurireducens TaxID=1604004 RepID=A0A0N9MXR1_9EURY|nr:2-phospho-L-lactate guanylyltransferase [Halanaeroarchaeum sulfurireducens]ALG82812.1 2-phospho-L-lactate guanylyltransferase [Halanaeroarchaeum sulfurireducens]
MRVVIPFDARNPKSRLSPTLDREERRDFSEAMLRDVIDVVRETGRSPEILSTAPVDVDATVSVDERPLTPLVNELIEDGTPIAVETADLAIATPLALDRLLGADGNVVVAPGREAGTNALVVRDPAFRVDYHGASFRDHLDRARAGGASVREVDSFRLATDIDAPADLLEVLVHGDGRASQWLRAAGFRVHSEGDEPRAVR